MSARPRSARVLHVIAGLEARHGGPSYSVPRLCAALAALQVDTTLATVAEAGAAPSAMARDGYREIREGWDMARAPLFGKLRLSTGLTRALEAVVPSVDVVHNHGLWLMPNVAAARVARRAAKPFVLSPRGMLAPEALAFSRRTKQVFWRLLQGPALGDLACLHVTSLQERDETRAFGLTAPVAVIPNGVDLPELRGARPVPRDGRREVLYIGRLHPKKSIDMLIEAWARLAPERRQGWRLRIVGPSEGGYGGALRNLAAARALTEVVIEPPIYGPAKFDAYRQADLFVLATRNENFGLTVAEALASETPAISTRGAPWEGLETERCGWWPTYGIEPLAAALDVALMLPASELRAMGARGRAWIARDFSWRAAAERLIGVYAWLRNGGEPPAAIVNE